MPFSIKEENMFNATYIMYNGIHSANFGLTIGSFNEESLVETTVFSPNISTSKTKNMKRFVASGIDEDSAPECEMTLVSNVPIHDIRKRDILSWLNSGKDFKKLVIQKPCTEEYYYMCKFKDIKELKVGSQCVGYSMTAVFDSPYQYGRDTELKLANGIYEDKLVSILNKSDFTDEYVYPLLSFTLSDGNSLKIVNITDDESRVFEFTNLPTNKPIIIDNELKIIDGDGALLGNFNKNWLRLVKGKNNLKITIKGSLKITCPQIISIGF